MEVLASGIIKLLHATASDSLKGIELLIGVDYFAQFIT